VLVQESRTQQCEKYPKPFHLVFLRSPNEVASIRPRCFQSGLYFFAGCLGFAFVVLRQELLCKIARREGAVSGEYALDGFIRFVFSDAVWSVTE